jgi:hypothetical protein
MTSRLLGWLAAATLVALALAWLLQPDAGPAAAGQRLLPGFADELNDVAALVLEPAGTESFRLERTADGWRAPAAGGYRVHAGEVRRFVARLAEARVVETKTANPELHPHLGVEVIDGQPGSGVLVRIEGASKGRPLLIGQREMRGNTGTYIRYLDNEVALLVDQDLQPARDSLGWLERELLDVPPEQIASLQIRHPDGEVLSIDRDELGIFRIANLPEGRAPSGPTAAEATVRALSALELDDVRTITDWDGEQPAVVAEFVLLDGLVIEVHSWRAISLAEGAEHWVAFAARTEPAQDGDAAAMARDLNERLGPWLYRLPAWKHEQLTRRLEDLLLPPPP